MAARVYAAAKRTGPIKDTRFKPGVRSSPGTEFKPGQPSRTKGQGSKVCKVCSATFGSNEGGKIYCSKACQTIDPEFRAKVSASKKGRPNLWQKGRPHSEETRRRMSAAKRGIPRDEWDGFSGSERHRLMGQPEYKAWRAAVFARDDHTCQECGAKRGYFHAAHIIGWAESEPKRYDVDNGRTLCHRCHFVETFGFFDEETALRWGVPKKYRATTP